MNQTVFNAKEQTEQRSVVIYFFKKNKALTVFAVFTENELAANDFLSLFKMYILKCIYFYE